MINIKDFDWNLLKIDKKPYKNISIYNIGYITIKKTDDYKNIHIVNPLHLITGKAIWDIEENNGNKYLVFGSTELHSSDKNKKSIKKIHRTLGWD